MSLALVQGIHRRPVNSPHKRSVMRKMIPFDDVIMNYQVGFLPIIHITSCISIMQCQSRLVNEKITLDLLESHDLKNSRNLLYTDTRTYMIEMKYVYARMFVYIADHHWWMSNIWKWIIVCARHANMELVCYRHGKWLIFCSAVAIFILTRPIMICYLCHLLMIMLLTGDKNDAMIRKCRYMDESFVPGCSASCENDNFRCNQWCKFRHNMDISVSL